MELKVNEKILRGIKNVNEKMDIYNI